MIFISLWIRRAFTYNANNEIKILAGKSLKCSFLRWRSYYYNVACKEFIVVVVQSLSYVQLFTTPWTAAHQASLPFTISWSLLKLISIESEMISNRLILCYPLLLPSIFPSTRVFSSWFFASGGQTIGFSFTISPSNEYSGLISFRIDWFDLLRPPCYSELLEGIITPLNASSTSLPCLHGCCTLQFSLIQATYSPVLQVLQSLEISCILLAAQHNFQLIISSPCTKTPLLFKFHTS